MKIIIKLIGIITLFFSFTSTVDATVISIDGLNDIGVNQEFSVNLMVDNEKDTINAIEGYLYFPSDLLSLEKISDGGSIISFWVERPLIGEKNQVRFSGIIPGGYDGGNGLVFKIFFKTKKEGTGNIYINNAKILLNDGKGTEANVSLVNFPIYITYGMSSFVQENIKDIDPPEVFTPMITRDKNIFYGKYFVVFETQDKGAGIDHYEVSEDGKSFVVAENPYLLRNQNLVGDILIKAVDKNGNERIASVSSLEQKNIYKNFLIYGIILEILLSIFLIIRLWKKKTKK